MPVPSFTRAKEILRDVLLPGPRLEMAVASLSPGDIQWINVDLQRLQALRVIVLTLLQIFQDRLLTTSIVKYCYVGDRRRNRLPVFAQLNSLLREAEKPSLTAYGLVQCCRKFVEQVQMQAAYTLDMFGTYNYAIVLRIIGAPPGMDTVEIPMGARSTLKIFLTDPVRHGDVFGMLALDVALGMTLMAPIA
jgi:hypothetical protein